MRALLTPGSREGLARKGKAAPIRGRELSLIRAKGKGMGGRPGKIIETKRE